MSQRINFRHRDRVFELRVCDDGAIELYLNGVLRKRRARGDREPQYVWTNVELEWEEHHYIEVRYWASRQHLRVTANGAVILEQSGGPQAPAL